MMQRIFVGDADCAVHLVRDQRAFVRGLRGAYFCRGDREGRVGATLDRARGRQCGSNRRGDFTREAREFLLDCLELTDLAPELRALARIAHREFERALERTGHRDRAHERAAFPQCSMRDAVRGGRDELRGDCDIIEHDVVARLEREIAPRRDRALRGIDTRDDGALGASGKHGKVARDARERHALHGAGQTPACAVLARGNFFAVHRCEGQRAGRNFQFCAGQQPPRERGFGERNRCAGTSRYPQHRGEVRQRAAGAAGLFRDRHQRQLRILDGFPQRRRPAVALRGIEHFGVDVVVKQARRRFHQHRAYVAHLARPIVHLSGPSSLRAIRLRRTCVVPPRMVATGAQTMVSAR